MSVMVDENTQNNNHVNASSHTPNPTSNNNNNNNNSMASMYNSIINVKDSRWLQLEVCREFQRGQCSRTDLECKFAHPPPHVDVQNGKVTACYDSIKGRCTRDNPKCKYLHPPQHLKDQLLINGRNNLAFKNLVMQQLANPAAAAVANQHQALNGLNQSLSQQQQQQNGLPQMMHVGTHPAAAASLAAAYANAQAAAQTMPGQLGVQIPGYYYNGMSALPQMYGGMMPALSSSPDLMQQMGVLQPPNGHPPSPATLAAAQQKRSDRVEVCREYLRGNCTRQESECKFAHPSVECERAADGTVTICGDYIRGDCQRAPCKYFHAPAHILAQIRHRDTQAALDVNGNPQNTMVQDRIRAHLQAQQHLDNLTAANQQLAAQQKVPATSASVQTTAASVSSTSHPTATSTAGAAELVSRKRRLDQELNTPVYQTGGHVATAANMSAATNSVPSVNGMDPVQAQLLLAALQSQQQQQQQQQLLMAQQSAQLANVPNKRVAIDKSGLPVYQPVCSSMSAINPAINQYYNLAALGYPAAAFSQQLGGMPQNANMLAAQQAAAFQGFMPVQLAQQPSTVALSQCYNGVVASTANATNLMALDPQQQLNNSIADAVHQQAMRGATNAVSVAYFDETGKVTVLNGEGGCLGNRRKEQELACQPTLEDYVDVSEGRVTVCRDAAKGKCSRVQCRYYHVPLGNRLMLLTNAQAHEQVIMAAL